MKRLLLALVLVTAIGAGCAPGFTKPATDVTATSATLNGEVASSVGGTVSYRFDWGQTTSFGESASGTVETEKDVKAPVSAHITDLEPQTLYYFHVCGNDDGRDVCSKSDTFTTLEEHSTAVVQEDVGDYVDFVSGRHRQNRLALRRGATPGTYVSTNTRDADHPNQGSFIDAGAGCVQLAPDSVECHAISPPLTETFVFLHDGDDRYENIDVNGVYGIFVSTAFGGEGDDLLIGAAGWDDLIGDGGADSMFGGAGTDDIDARDNAIDDTIDCGQGGETLHGAEGLGDYVLLDPEELDAHTDVNCESRAAPGTN